MHLNLVVQYNVIVKMIYNDETIQKHSKLTIFDQIKKVFITPSSLGCKAYCIT